MRLYKLTDVNGQTRNKIQWGEGVTHTASGIGALSKSGWIRTYTDPLLAILLNPIHSNYENPLLWEAEGTIEKRNYGLCVGSRSLRAIHRIPLPEISTEQRVKFAILCVLEVYAEPTFCQWANKWLTGEDRTVAAALATWVPRLLTWVPPPEGRRAIRPTHEVRASTWAAKAAGHMVLRKEKEAAGDAGLAAMEAALVGPLDLAALAAKVMVKGAV